MDSLLSAYDKMKSLLNSIEEYQNENIDVDETIKELTELIAALENGDVVVEKKKPAKKSSKKSAKSETIKENKVEINSEAVSDVKSELNNEDESEDADEEQDAPQIENKQVNIEKVKQDSSKKVENSIRVDVERLDELLNIVSELVLGRNRLAQVNSEFALENEGTKFSRDLLMLQSR